MSLKFLVLTLLSLLAFASNSLLCRLALKQTGIDPAAFILVRILSAALMLLALVALRKGKWHLTGSWRSASALVLYALPFTFSYVSLSAGTGALLAFGAVQITMIGAGWRRGERFNAWQCLGLAMALGGILALLLPGITAPSPLPALMMLVGGMGWGLYSLCGKGNGDPLAENAGNFLRAIPLTVLFCLPFLSSAHWGSAGIVYAILSGAGASAIGYVIWYLALRGLSATSAATVQLSVPVITALLSIPLLGEPLTLRLTLVSSVILGGIALAILKRHRART